MYVEVDFPKDGKRGTWLVHVCCSLHPLQQIPSRHVYECPSATGPILAWPWHRAKVTFLLNDCLSCMYPFHLSSIQVTSCSSVWIRSMGLLHGGIIRHEQEIATVRVCLFGCFVDCFTYCNTQLKLLDLHCSSLLRPSRVRVGICMSSNEVSSVPGDRTSFWTSC